MVVQVQAPAEPQWFAFQTDVSLRTGERPRARLAWSVLLLTACAGGAAVYAALAWLVPLDAEPLVRRLGDLSGLLGFIST